ncbi:MAG: polysaccharide deacetylase family protein [Anaerolineae bacterium]|jgi:peptidoglycan/xylan/chitin deacetylase (PgdA/CDA1 family)|nr:polysaccharide deacetylase family protein [Anaerolineae bacterium]
MSFIAFATRAKGPMAFLRRIGTIYKRYGLTTQKMEQSLDAFAQVLKQFDCGATFPITAVALQRNPAVISKHLGGKIEFAVHGYTHIDYAEVAPDLLQEHLRRAGRIFAAAGVPMSGFRSPYLRRGENLYKAFEPAGFSYVSNQPIWWDVLEEADFDGHGQVGYQRALAFYEPWRASERLSLPHLSNGLVEIPVSLPDDEILLDRMSGEGSDLVEKVWRRILDRAYQSGELFVLQLHPERIAPASEGLIAVLEHVRSFVPSVWMARLDEVAKWWRARLAASVRLANVKDGVQITVTGPEELTLLARGVESDVPVVPWKGAYRRILATSFTVRSALRPFVGLSPEIPPELADFLKIQGYIVEFSREHHRYACYFHRAEDLLAHPRALLAHIEDAGCPLVKVGRWPNGAACAFSITGDIDALTLWDYGLRVLGK